jgi:hypothetical protein
MISGVIVIRFSSVSQLCAVYVLGRLYETCLLLQIRTAVYKKIQKRGKFIPLNICVCSLSAASCSWHVDAVSADGASKGLSDVLYSTVYSLSCSSLLMTENIFWPF